MKKDWSKVIPSTIQMLKLKPKPEVLGKTRLPKNYYARQRLFKRGFPPQIFIPSQRCSHFTLLPFKNWTLEEVVALNFLFGQTFSFTLEPIDEPYFKY